MFLIKIDKCSFLCLDMIYVLGEFVLFICKFIFVFNCEWRCFLILWDVMYLFLWFVNGLLFIRNVICSVGLLICNNGNVFWCLIGYIVLFMLMFFILEMVIKFFVFVFLIFWCFNFM